MSTLIDSNGRMKNYSAGSQVLGPYAAYRRLIGCKLKCTSSPDASGGVIIPWESPAIFDTHKFVATFPNNYVTIPMNGWYSVIAYINTSETTAHMGRIAILINDVERAVNRVDFADVGGMNNSLNISLSRYWMVAGDKVSVNWDSGGMVIGMEATGEAGCTLTVWRVG